MTITLTTLMLDGDLYRQACNLRYDVFFKPHQLPYDILFDEHEPLSEHLGFCQQGQLIACTRLTPHKHGHYQISQMVVDPLFTRRGYGTLLLQQARQRAIDNKAQQIFLYARLAFRGFYEKQGFRPEGDEFLSKTTQLPHIKMLYQGLI